MRKAIVLMLICILVVQVPCFAMDWKGIVPGLLVGAVLGGVIGGSAGLSMQSSGVAEVFGNFIGYMLEGIVLGAGLGGTAGFFLWPSEQPTTGNATVN